MRNLKKTKTNPIDFLQQIVSSKKGDNKTRMERLHPQMIDRFREYNDKAGSNSLHTLQVQWSYDSKAKESDGYFLYIQYDNSEAKIADLRARIIASNDGKITLTCPICGRQDATDLDHYIPRQILPEFSIHPYNLIPTCHRCNNNKGTLWLESGNRLIFNAYYDTVTDEELFDMNVVIQNKLPVINLKLKKFSTPVKPATRIALSTIEKLELLPIFQEETNKNLKEEIMRIKVLAKRHTDIDSIKGSYSDMAEEQENINDLKKILFNAIAHEPTLNRWIEQNLFLCQVNSNSENKQQN